MLGPSHAILGAAGGVVAGAAIEAPFTMKCIMAAFGAFGGLVADADTASSTLGQLLHKKWHEKTPGHRGLTHSLFWTAIVFLVTYGIQYAGTLHIKVGDSDFQLWEQPEKPWIPVAITAGQLTHLIADGLTVQGVPFFYPLWKKRICLLGSRGFTTGTDAERVALIALLALAGGYVFGPLVDWLIDKVFTAPVVHSFDTEPVIVFVVTAGICGLLLWLYSSRKATKKSGRRPKRSIGARSTARSPRKKR